MVMSRDIGDLSQLINAQGSKKPQNISTSGKNKNDFQNILKDMLPNVQDASLTPAAIPALNKEQLLLFSRALQIQMNSRLYNAVFNNTLESNALALKVMRDYGSNITNLISEASKNGQEMPRPVTTEGDDNLNQIVNQAAKKYDVDADLIRSVIKAESNFNSSATSSVGAMGLMQLMPETARELGVNNAYDPRENVMGGVRYLKMLLDRYGGQVDLALAAYNWGMGNLEKNPERLPSETLSYVEKVNSNYKSMKG